MAHFMFDNEELRLHAIAEPTANNDRSYDIVALHGIGGTWDRSWTKSDGTCWLCDTLPVKLASSRILSYNCPNVLQYFGTGRGDVDSLIAKLVHDRDANRRSRAPIIFIGHSFGGNLLKQIFVATHPSKEPRVDYQNVYESIRAYVFLGTPNQAIDHKNLNAFWRALDRDSESSLGGNTSHLVDALEGVDRINDDFRRLGGEDLPALCFYEGRKTLIGIRESLIVPREKALYLSRPVTGGQLDLRHGDMGRLGDSNDSNARRLMLDFQNLLTIIESPDFTRSTSNRLRRRGLNLLSLDGGGVRGLFSLIVLEAILAEVERRDTINGSRRLPYEYFDLIGGTSTGGLLAIMLGRLQMDIPSCLQAYRNMSENVFSRSDNLLSSVRDGIDALVGNPWFSGDQLKAAICGTVRDQISVRERSYLENAGLTVEDVRLLSTDVQKTRCFVCAICEGHHRAERIRSYLPANRAVRDTSSYTIWQAGRATSAAPMYFPAIDIQGHHYFDGGLQCNNPVLEVVEEAHEEFPDADIDTIVSIGTGKGAVSDPLPPVFNVITSLIGRLTNAEAQHEQFISSREFEKLRASYFRFQEEEDLGKIDLAASDKIDEIEKLAREYVKSPTTKRSMEICAARILKSPRF